MVKKESFKKNTIESLIKENFEQFLVENKESIDCMLEHINDGLDNEPSGDLEIIKDER